MSVKPPCGAVVFVADVRRAAGFYRGIAGMALAHEDADHTVLALDGFELVIHRLAGEPRPAEPVSIRADSYVKICLPVASIPAARQSAPALGGAINPCEFEWQARNFRACDGHDPEGNVIQVREAVIE